MIWSNINIGICTVIILVLILSYWWILICTVNWIINCCWFISIVVITLNWEIVICNWLVSIGIILDWIVGIESILILGSWRVNVSRYWGVVIINCLTIGIVWRLCGIKNICSSIWRNWIVNSCSSIISTKERSCVLVIYTWVCVVIIIRWRSCCEYILICVVIIRVSWLNWTLARSLIRSSSVGIILGNAWVTGNKGIVGANLIVGCNIITLTLRNTWTIVNYCVRLNTVRWNSSCFSRPSWSCIVYWSIWRGLSICNTWIINGAVISTRSRPDFVLD